MIPPDPPPGEQRFRLERALTAFETVALERIRAIRRDPVAPGNIAAATAPDALTGGESSIWSQAPTYGFLRRLFWFRQRSNHQV